MSLHHLLMREFHNPFNRQLAREAEVKHIAKAKLQQEFCSIMSYHKTVANVLLADVLMKYY